MSRQYLRGRTVPPMRDPHHDRPPMTLTLAGWLLIWALAALVAVVLTLADPDGRETVAALLATWLGGVA